MNIKKIISILFCLIFVCFISGNSVKATEGDEVLLQTSQNSAQNGFVEIDGEWYYYENGEPVVEDWRYIGSYYYYFDYNGIMVNNQASYNIYGYNYGFDENGHMIIGWYEWGDEYWSDKRYYDNSGHAVYGKTVINGEYYLFNEWGTLITSQSYVLDNTIYITNEDGIIIEEVAIKEGWIQAGNDWYYGENGSILTNSWKKVGSYWYYLNYNGKMVNNQNSYYIDGYTYGFDENGHMLTGWYNWGDEYNEYWFYYNESGHSVSGKVLIDGDYYLFSNWGSLIVSQSYELDGIIYITDENGIITQEVTIKNGWIQIGDDWYYGENESILTNSWKKVGSYWYYFDYDGRMINNQQSFYIDGYYYGFDKNGHMLTGWNDWGNEYYENWYYYDASGHAASGKTLINGKHYLFDDWGSLIVSQTCGRDGFIYVTNEDGVITQEVAIKNGWIQMGDDWYYGENGSILTYQFKTIGNYTYYFDNNGKMISDETHYLIYSYDGSDYHYYSFDKNGHMIKNEWVRDEKTPDKWYYQLSDGTSAIGWKLINSKYYYFNQYDGMVCDTVLYLDDKYYLFDSSGAYLGEVNQTNGWNLNGGYYYYVENGEVVHGWKNLNGTWYYLDQGGRMVTHITFIDGKYYYFNYSGALQKNKWILDTYYGWVYVKSDGSLACDEWLKINGKWYYFDFCTMVNDTIAIDNKIYFFNSNGSWNGKSRGVTDINGWIYYNGDYHYVKNHKLVSGWQLINNKWYYLDEYDYSMHTGVIEDNGKFYFLDENGAMKTNGWFEVNDSWYTQNGKGWVYADSSGKLATGWQKIGNYWYYFTPVTFTDGIYQIDEIYYNFDANGHYVNKYTPSEGWNNVNGKWYYFKDNVLEFSYTLINNTYYLLSPYMLSNYYDGYYYFGNDGKLFTNGWIKYEDNWLYVNKQGTIYRNQTRIIDGKIYRFDIMGFMI